MARAEDDLDAEKHIAHELPPRLLTLGESLRKMHRSPHIGQNFSLPAPQRGDRGEIGGFERAVDELPQHPRGNPITCRVDRNDTFEVDRGAFLDDLELGMLHGDLLGAHAGFSKNHEPIALADHVFYPRHIEPAAHQRPAEQPAAFFHEPHLENRASAETAVAGFFHHATQAHRRVGGLVGKPVKPRAVLVTAWKVAK